MKKYFINMFGYDLYANKIIFSVIRTTGEVAKPIELMKHIFSVSQVWYDRCKGERTYPGTQTANKDDQYIGVEDLITQNYDAWMSFINGLSDTDFERPIQYQNSTGKAFENSLSDMLTQVINHGTHHRAQIGQHLKIGNGLDALPNTDYINYIRLQTLSK